MRHSNLRVLLIAIIFLGVISCSNQKEETKVNKPNIIFLLADDLGRGDVGCFDGRRVDTPHLDNLAKEGIKFNNFYSAAAVCSPSRVSCLTGRFPYAFNITGHFHDKEEHMPTGAVTIPELLKEAGYVSKHIGKWHLGGLNVKHCEDRANSIPGPLEHGFDHYLTMYEDPAIRADLITERMLYRTGAKYLVRNDKKVDPIDGHWTDVKVDEGLEFIDESHQNNQPFYLNFWFDVPHTPYEPAPSPIIDPYVSRAKGDDLLYRSMVAHMDASIGRIVAKVKELGIEENTLIFFTSDNGPSHQGSPSWVKGRKCDLHEGGIHQAALASWKGQIKPGSQSDELANTVDLLSTFCAAAGVQLPADLKQDGVNILPTMVSGKAIPERTMFWKMKIYNDFYDVVTDVKPMPINTEIVRRGKWKLLAKDGAPTELYNLDEDPLERWNLVETWPEITNELTGELTTWLETNPVSTEGTDPETEL